jgi:hypothetical protein
MDIEKIMATFQELYQRENQVIVKGQSVRFRVIKYIIILTLGTLLYLWKGLATVSQVLLVLTIVAICIHFLFRWKSHGWTKSWGPYKKINL